MELSTLIGKQILAPNGEILGYVKNAYLTQGNKKVSSLECIDGEENEFYISARAVLSVGDAVMVSGADGNGLSDRIGCVFLRGRISWDSRRYPFGRFGSRIYYRERRGSPFLRGRLRFLRGDDDRLSEQKNKVVCDTF